jgi:TatD DNase family protein
MKFVDAHIHLSDPEYTQKLNDIIDDAKKSNVVALVSNSADLKTSLLSLQLSKDYPHLVHSAVGIHPWNVKHLKPDEIQEIARLVLRQRKQGSKVVAVGEIGLDYQYAKTKELQGLQHEVFHEMLRAAEKSSLPVIIHSRGTTPEIIKLLDSYQLKKVLLHWFSRPLTLLPQIVDRGYYVSEGPPAVFSSRIREVIRRVPLTNLLTETDGPVLYWGLPFKGKMTTPSFIPQIVTTIAELKGRNENEVADQILQNFTNLFEISLV